MPNHTYSFAHLLILHESLFTTSVPPHPAAVREADAPAVQPPEPHHREAVAPAAQATARIWAGRRGQALVGGHRPAHSTCIGTRVLTLVGDNTVTVGGGIDNRVHLHARGRWVEAACLAGGTSGQRARHGLTALTGACWLVVLGGWEALTRTLRAVRPDGRGQKIIDRRVTGRDGGGGGGVDGGHGQDGEEEEGGRVELGHVRIVCIAGWIASWCKCGVWGY